MKLTKLELHGFKSFADKTVLHFDAGATVIVGPNGCGKSNIVDAFKWVLGEQSAKSLRGDGMQDVIFNGSGGRKPAGLAEVILTFDNSDGRLPVEQREVSVGRRLYRDGASEYLLNKQVVRLKDIKELFMDTGVGVDAYSLVEQGKVDQVLASNTMERRAIFEEAAGVSKYRARKREAVRKLERVDQNLLRLTDIVDEVDRRLRAIKAAATKARNYQELSTRLRELRASHFVYEYDRLAANLADAAEQVRQTSGLVNELAGRRGDSETRLADLDEQQLNLAAALAEAENRLVQIASQMANHQDRMKFAGDREKELADELTRRREAMVTLRHRLGELEAQDRELAELADQLDAAAESARSQIETIGRDQHAAEVEIQELADQADRANQALFELMRQASQLSNQIHQFKTTQENLAGQRDRLSGRSNELAGQLARRSEEREQLRGAVAELEQTLAQLQREQEQTKVAAAAKDASIRELAGRLGRLKEHRSAIASRHDLLASLERKLEGIADGPRALLQAQADAGDSPDRPHVDGLAGLVADLLMVPHHDEPARLAETAAVVQAALGDRDQWVVVRDSAALAGEPARRLLAELPGQAHLLCLDRLAGRPAEDLSPWLAQPGVIGPVADLVACEPVFLPIRQRLLGAMLRVDSIETAIRLAAAAPNDCRVQWLSPEGCVVSADGQVRVPAGRDADAGSQSPATFGLIGRKAELRELSAQLETLQGEVAELESQLAAESAEAAELDRLQQELRSEVYQCSTQRVESAARLRQAEQAIDGLTSEQALIASEMSDLSLRIDQAGANEAAASEKLAAADDRRDELQAQADELVRQLQQRRSAAESMNRTMTEARVALGQAEERRRAVRQQLAAARRGLEEVRTQQATAHSDCRSLVERIEQSQQAQLASESAISELYLDRQQFADRRADLAGSLARVRRDLGELEAQSKAAAHELHAAEQAMHEAQVTQNELRVRLETLVQRVADEHNIDLPRLHADSPPDLSSGIDWQAVEAEIAELRGRIDRLGNVNLEAIDEQAQLEQRSEFLHQQLADVTVAKGQLEALIERINTESRKRFEETFNQIREHFRELFRRLFGGGKADLVLENPDDILESGIDIIARPPGKELRSITLLSGGEKTMTALALLLSIFRSKPSPFCILDEVDAALDEANNDRFDQLIRDFMSFSQFIIVTHSKQTMTIGDVLYGITMQEQGVSKQVAVRFDGKSVHGDDGELLEDGPQTQVA